MAATCQSSLTIEHSRGCVPVPRVLPCALLCVPLQLHIMTLCLCMQSLLAEDSAQTCLAL